MGLGSYYINLLLRFNCRSRKTKTDLPSAFIDFGIRNRGEGRPTKKDRRNIDHLSKTHEDWRENWQEEE